MSIESDKVNLMASWELLQQRRGNARVKTSHANMSRLEREGVGREPLQEEAPRPPLSAVPVSRGQHTVLYCNHQRLPAGKST